MTNEFFDDPSLPDRPQHPDFWRLVAAVNKADAYATEDNLSLPEILIEHAHVDPDSLIYMAKQRVLRATQPITETTLIALYLDAFTAGALYERGD